jgi:hypothetical protein
MVAFVTPTCSALRAISGGGSASSPTGVDTGVATLLLGRWSSSASAPANVGPSAPTRMALRQSRSYAGTMALLPVMLGVTVAG